jgi:uncharacterized protein (DUF302 family)
LSLNIFEPAGMVRIASQHSASETVARLKALLQARGVELFAHIDFSADAQRAGLTLRPEHLLLFGNPKAGTPLMQSVPSVGLDLPLKALIWEAADGQSYLAYNDPRYILQRHGVSSELGANLASLLPLLQRATEA